MVHAAMFDAVNSIERRYRPYRAKSWMRDLRGGKYATPSPATRHPLFEPSSLFANGNRTANIARARELLGA